MVIGHIGDVVRRRVGSRTYYVGTVQSDKIKGITFVPVLETSKNTYVREDPDNGYQRPGSRTRMRAFMRYLQENPNSVVPPVLLSAADWQFVSSGDNADYGTLDVSSPAAIIDGQHRVGGYISLLEEKGHLIDRLSSHADLKVITRWNAGDLASGVSDPFVFEECRDRHIPLYLHPSIHLKLITMSNKILLFYF